MKGVKNYLKNVGKSLAYSAIDVTKQDLTPNIAEFADANVDFLKNSYLVLKNPKTATKKVIESISESKVFKAVDYGARNVFEDLRTGDFYAKEREERDAGKLSGLEGADWGDLSEFDIDDDWESKMDSSSDEGATVGEMQIVDSIEKSNKALANTTSATIAAAAEVTMKNNRVNTGILYEQNERLFGGIHNDLSIVGATMNTILKLHSEVLPNIDKNMSSYFSESLKMQKENNAAIKEMLEMQRNMYKSATEREEEEARKKKKYGNRYSDITSGGIPNISEYFGHVKGNINKKMAETLGISDFSEDGNILAAMMTSPLRFVTQELVKKVIPEAVKQASKELDNTASGIFGQIMGRISNAAADADNDLLSSILGIFGVKTGVNKKIDTSKYHKGPVPFDGVTRKAIIDVIPTYLRRIEAALTGNQETMYDYSSGKWVKARDVKKQFDDIRKNSISSATSDIRGAMNDAIKLARNSTDVRDRESLDAAWDEFYQFLYDRNGIFDPKKSFDANKINNSYTNLKKHYETICQVYSDFDYNNAKKRNSNLSTRMNIANRILSAKDSEERQYRAMEDGMNIFAQYFGSPDFDTHGKFKGKNKDKFVNSNDRLVKVVDDKGNNIFNYLQKISAELEWQRLNGFGGGRKRGKGGNSSSNSNSSFDSIYKGMGKINPTDTGDIAKSQADHEKELKKALKAISEGRAADFTIFDENEAEYYDQLSYYLRNQATEAERKRFMDNVKSGGAVSEFINGANKMAQLDKKDEEKYLKETNELIKNNFDESKDEEKKESIIDTIFGKANKAKDFLSSIVQAPGEIFSDLIYSADKAIYHMFFRKELKDEGEEGTEEYEGFLDFLAGKTKKTFETIADGLTEKVINPLREKLGIGDDFESRVKDSVKNIAYGLGGKVIDFNKQVYSPAYESLLNQLGLQEYLPASADKRARADARKKVGDMRNTVSNISSLDDEALHQIAKELGIKVEKIKDLEDFKKKANKKLDKNLLKNTKGLTEVDNATQLKDVLTIFLNTKEGKTLSGLSQKAKELGLDIKNNPVTLEDFQREFRFAAIDKYHNNAKGTISSIPFRGNTMLSKGEMLFNNNGVGVVGKTGAYRLDNPTHILSSYDSHPILKSMGINMGSRKTPAQDLMSENNMKNKLFGKASNITNHAGGTTAKVSNGIDYDLIRSNLKEYAPEGVAGGIVGGIVSTLFGVVGGPLVGAAVGAAGNIIASSDTLKDSLFGPLGEDGKRSGGKLLNEKVMGTINKYLPDMAKYGAAGIIPGLLTPLGPLGGVLVGGAIGMLKNNEAFTNKYFGEEGKLSFDDKTKKIVEDMLPGAAKGAAAGVIATLFGGPFGFLGNAAIGSAIGMALSTEEFKEGILGREINGIRNGGLLGTVKEAFEPLLGIGDTLKNKLIRAVDEGIVEPVAKFLTPSIHELPHLLSWGPRQLNKFMEKMFHKDNFIGHALSGLVNNRITKGIGGAAGKVIDFAGDYNPIKLLGVAGDKIRGKQIRDLRADYMYAEDRINFMGNKDYKNRAFDEALSTIGQENGLSIDKVKQDRIKLLSIRNSASEIDRALKKQQKEITARIDTFTVRDGATFTKKMAESLKKRIEKSDFEGFSSLLDKAVLTDGRGISDEERKLFMEGSEDGVSSFRNSYVNLQNLTEAKKLAGSMYGKSDRQSALKDLMKELAGDYGIDANSIKNFSDLDKLINNMDTELTRIDANKGPEEIVSPELLEEREQTEALKQGNEKLTEINELLRSLLNGTSDIISNNTEAVNTRIDKSNRKSGSRRAKRYDKIDLKVFDRMGINLEDLSDDARTAITSNSPDLIKAINRGRITNSQELENAVSSGIKGKQMSFLNKIKKVGYLVDPDAINYLSTINPEYSKKILRILTNKNVVNVLIKSRQSGTVTPLSGNDFEIVYRCNESKFINKFKIINSAIDNATSTEQYNNITSKFNSISAVNSSSIGAIIAMSKSTPIANNGFGTFLLNGAKAIGSGISKGAKAIGGGISKLFGGGENGEGGAGKAAGMLSSLLSARKGDDDDHEMSGNNMVREDGNSMKMKKDSDGSLVPDTTDSNTKKTLNLIAAKEKAQNRLNDIQEKAMTKINEMFDTESKGKKENKLGKILAAAFGGYALIKSGLLKKLYEGLIKPIWTENIKPWIDDTAVPWIKDKAEKVGSWFKDTAIPWLRDEGLPALGNFLKEIGPEIGSVIGSAIKNLLPAAGDIVVGVLDGLAGNKNNAGTSTKTDMNTLKDDVVFYDENGNALTKEQAAAYGGAITNKNGDEVIFNEDGTVVVNDGSKRGSSYLATMAKGAGNVIKNTITGSKLGKLGSKMLHGADNIFGKLAKSKKGPFKLARKVVGYAGKAFTSPLAMVDNAANAVKKSGGVFNAIGDGVRNIYAKKSAKMVDTADKLINNKFTNKILGKEKSDALFEKIFNQADQFDDIGVNLKDKITNNKLTNTIDGVKKGASNKIKSIYSTVKDKFNKTSVSEGLKNAKTKVDDVIGGLKGKAKSATESAKKLIDDALENLPKALDNLFESNKVLKKLKEVAEFVGIKPDKVAGWVKTFKTKIDDLFLKAIKNAGPEAVEQGAKAAGKGLLSKVAFWAFLITDFVAGMDKAESILGVEETDVGEELACGLTNALCNLLIVPAIIPGVNKIAVGILDILGVDLDARQKEAQAETDKYNAETGENLTTEERLDQQKSVTGSLWHKAKTSANNWWKKTTSSAKNFFSKDKGGGSGSAFGKSKFGMAKQIDPRIAGMRFNAPGDTMYQTIGDSGCGPAAAVTAIESAYGRSANTINAAQFALRNGYKEKNGGTKPGFFSDYFKQHGLGSTTTSNRTYLENNIRSGNPTVLMGQDKGGVNRNNPFGKNPHYVTATGVDGRGNVIIQDPESKYNNQVYKMSDVINKTSLGVSAHGRGRTFYGRSKYGRSTDIPSQVWGFLKNNGFSDEAAAGIMANLKAESGLNPTTIQGNGKGPAAGICQWENYNTKSGRWKNLYNYCKKQGKDWTDLACQLNFMLSELDSCLKTYSGSGYPKHPYSKYPTTEVGWAEKMNLAKYKALTNVNDATKIFSQCFERAGIPHMDRRLQYAAEFLKDFAGKTGTAIDDTTATDSGSTNTVSGFAGILSNALNNSKIGQIFNQFTGAITGSSDSSASDSSSSSSGGVAGADAQSVVQVAAKEVGTKEKPMGSNNIKYNDWYYGRNVSGSAYPWCAAYVSWVADQAGVDKSIIPKDAYTVTMYNTITKKGKAVDRKDGLPGDIMFVTNNGSPSGIRHTGVVEDVSNNEIHTIEGNSSDQVIRRSYATSNTKILLARPAYANQSASKTDSSSNSSYAKVDDPDNYSALGTGSNKPLSRYGMYKESIKGTRRTDNSKKPKKIKNVGLNGDFGIIEDTNPDTMNKEAAAYSRYGMASSASTNYNYTKLIETVIEVLFTIADNTDKLNMIVSILNDKLGVDISKEVNNKTDKTTMKNRIKSALSSRTQANTFTNSDSIDSIVRTMNALAAE